MIMTSPADCVSIIFVTSGTRGDRLLFRYPIELGESVKTLSKLTKKNPYAVKVAEDLQSSKNKVASSILKRGRLTGISDKTLASLLGVKSNLCSQKFDIKIDDVRFLGFPMLLDDIPDKQTATGKTAHKILSFNVAFVVQANASPSVVDCFHDLAKQLSVALKHEEKRCQYLSSQAKIMTTVHDDVAALPEDSLELPYSSILKKSEFAKNLKVIYESLKGSGVVHIYINNWVEVNFILPHKVHYILLGEKTCAIEPDAIQSCLDSVRPYHGMLLLKEETALLETLPIDCNPALVRLIQVSKPVRNLQTLALEADLSLSQVFRLVCHLVYWGKATIIYPLCETNVYVLSPMANTLVSSKLVMEFEKRFGGTFLPTIMSEFSFPTQMQDTRNILNDLQQQDRKVQMVVWMLQHHLLMQLHTYIFFVAPDSRRRLKSPEEMLRKLSVHDDNSNESLNRLQRSHSLSDIASVNSDESMGPVMHPSSIMSKSPSSEFTTDSSVFSEDIKAFLVQDSVLRHLSIEEQEAIMNVPAAKNLEDLKLFAKKSNSISIEKGSNSIEKGSNSIEKGSNSIEKDSNSIESISNSIESGSNSIEKGSNSIEKGSNRIESGCNSIESGSNSIESGCNSIESGSNSIESSSNSIEKGSNSIVKVSNSIESGSNSIEKGSNSIVKVSNMIESGSNSIESGSNRIESGSNNIESGSNRIESGIKSIESGSNSIEWQQQY